MNKYRAIMERIGYWVPRPQERLQPTLELVEDFEAQIGHALPGDYREFLLDYAGLCFVPESRVYFPASNPLRNGPRTSTAIPCF